MRMKYISKVQLHMKRYQTIHTNKKTTQVLDGSYASVYKGRSTNFDELREYAAGDDVKDIDWKASARSRKMLVRQYIAEKKHNIMLVLDTNKRMLGDSFDGEEKKEIALVSAGTLACLVNRNGDYISAIYSSKESIQYYPLKTGLMHIENILAHYDKAVTMENHSSLEVAIHYIIHNFRRKMILLIVTDTEGILELSEESLKRLKMMHDVLIVRVSDTDATGKFVFDLEGEEYLPDFFTKDKKLLKLAKTHREKTDAMCEDKLKQYGIACATIDSLDEMDEKIVELLNEHRGGVN